MRVFCKEAAGSDGVGPLSPVLQYQTLEWSAAAVCVDFSLHFPLLTIALDINSLQNIVYFCMAS